MIAAAAADCVGQDRHACSDALTPYEIELQHVLHAKNGSRLVPAPRQLAICADLACLPALRGSEQNGICLLPLPSDPVTAPLGKHYFPTSHQGSITAATFGSARVSATDEEARTKRLFVTGSGDALIAWTVTTLTQDDHVPAFVSLEALADCKLGARGDVCSHLSLNAAETLVAACVGSDVHVCSLKAGRAIAKLVGHLANVNTAEFFEQGFDPVAGRQHEDSKLDNRHNWFISASEDRTFKIWDITNQTCLLQSTILSPHPITSLAVQRESGRVALGFEDGTLRIYHIRCASVSSKLKCEYQCLRTINVGSVFQKAREVHESGSAQTKSVLPRIIVGGRGWKGDTSTLRNAQDRSSEETVESNSNFSLLNLTYMRAGLNFGDDNPLATRRSSATILISTSAGIVVLDASSFDALNTFEFRDPLPLPAGRPKSRAAGAHVDGSFRVPFPSTFAVAHVENWPSTYIIGIGSAFGSSFTVLHLKAPTHPPLLSSSQRMTEIPALKDSVFAAVSAELSGTDSLPRVVRLLLQLEVRGAWLDGVYRDSIRALAAVGIRRIADLHKVLEPDVLKGTTCIPKFLLQGLAEIALKLRKEKAFGNEESRMPLTLALPERAILPAGSPLRNFRFVEKPVYSPPMRPLRQSLGKQKAASLDMPITYRSKIPSSGYTSSPKIGMRKANVNSPRSKGPNSLKTSNAEDRERQLSDYRRFAERVRQPDKALAVQCHCATVTSVQHSPAGTHVSTASADSNARWLRIPGRAPTTAPAIRDLIGHDAAVNCVTWDSSGVSILTASSDRTARIWDVANSENLLTFSHLEGNCARRSDGLTVGETPFTHEIKCASFFYADRFVLLSVGKGVHMYKYTRNRAPFDGATPKKPPPTTIPRGSADAKRTWASIRPILKQNKYERVISIAPAPNAQAVTAFGCVNHAFRSAIIAVATSDRTLTLWDVNAGKPARIFQDAHTRPAHVVHFPDYVGACPATSDLILSAAPTDCIRLWDVRSQRAVRVFDGHKNRFAAVRCAISPCGTFLATGSECTNAFVYDVRQGTVLSRHKGHTDMVFDVSWNPNRPELATAGGDGKLRFFRV